MIGAEYVANSAPDGYRLLNATSSYPGAVATRAKLPFDPAGAFVPVAMFARAPFVLAVHPSVPARTVKEFIALAKQRSLTYSSSGAGGSNHFAMELLGQLAGFRMVHVPYKGSPEAITSVIRGDTQLYYLSVNLAVELHKAGKVRVMAVSIT